MRNATVNCLLILTRLLELFSRWRKQSQASLRSKHLHASFSTQLGIVIWCKTTKVVTRWFVINLLMWRKLFCLGVTSCGSKDYSFIKPIWLKKTLKSPILSWRFRRPKQLCRYSNKKIKWMDLFLVSRFVISKSPSFNTYLWCKIKTKRRIRI